MYTFPRLLFHIRYYIIFTCDVTPLYSYTQQFTFTYQVLVKKCHNPQQFSSQYVYLSSYLILDSANSIDAIYGCFILYIQIIIQLQLLKSECILIKIHHLQTSLETTFFVQRHTCDLLV
jgi:hypothetical protein